MKNMLLEVVDGLPDLIGEGQEALAGDSGDAEAEALAGFISWARGTLSRYGLAHMIPEEPTPWYEDEEGDQ